MLPNKTASINNLNCSPKTLEALVAQALSLGRWLSCCDSWGRRALVVLGELFRMESCGAAEVSFVLFTTSWPQFSFKARSLRSL